jgi:hypothetical protein
MSAGRQYTAKHTPKDFAATISKFAEGFRMNKLHPVVNGFNPFGSKRDWNYVAGKFMARKKLTPVTFLTSGRDRSETALIIRQMCQG